MPESSLDLFSITAPGLERITEAELRALGISSIAALPRGAARGGVGWSGTMDDVYAANLWLRTASRVIVRVARFHASSFHELERRARHVPWAAYLRSGDAVRFRVTCHKSALYHSDAVAQRLAASAAAAAGAHPSGAVDDEDEEGSAEQLFVVRLDHDAVTISADSSGALLHRRGYRQAVAKAPLRETLAAAMLLSSGWASDLPLLDPMCGSGTIPIEAALIARRMAPGIGRGFAFERWPAFDATAWARHRDRALENALPAASQPIVAADRDQGAIAACVANSARAGVEHDVAPVHRSLSASVPVGAHPGWVITNPPYGVRVGTDVRDLYARLGALIRGPLAGWRLGMLGASPALERQLGVPVERVFETSNGGIRVSFVRSRERSA